MKQDMYSNELISAENQSAEIYPQAYREEVCLIVSLNTLFENINLVKRYDKTNLTVFACSLWKKYRWGLTSFGQYSWLKLCIEHYLHLEFLELSK